MRRRTRILAALAVAAAGGVALAAPDTIGFGGASGLGGNDQPGNVLVADVTGDGVPDVVTLPRSGAYVRIRSGAGGAVTDVATSGNSGLRIVRAARLNGDAALDLVVDHGTAPGQLVNTGVVDQAQSPGLDILVSDGHGGFTLTSSPASPAQFTEGEVPSFADWDGDGDLDILSISFHAVFRVRLNDGAGGFGAAKTVAFPPGTNYWGTTNVVGADLDGDGDTDLAMGDALVVFWRQADGSLSQPVRVGWLATDRGVSAVDVDGDGFLDLVAQSSFLDRTGPHPVQRHVIGVARHATAATFLPPEAYSSSVAKIPLSFDVADLNGDARPEIVTPLAVYVNRGDGTFGPPLPLPATGIGAASGDLLGDDRPEIVVADPADGAKLVSVTAGAAPPTISALKPPTLFLGAIRNLTIEGAGFDEGAVLDFGDGLQPSVPLSSEVFPIAVTRTPTSIEVQIVVSPSAVPGPRTLTVVNPDGGAGSVAYAIASGGIPTIESVTPSRFHAGETVEFVVRGTEFVEGLELQFGNGMTVAATELLGEDLVRATVETAPDAQTGPRDLFLLNGSGFQAAAAGAFTVLPPRSVDVVPRRGRLVPSGERADGTFTASGLVLFNELSPDGFFHPENETAEIRFGDPERPTVIPIPAGAGWRTRKLHATWRSPRGSGPRVLLDLDFRNHTFRVEVERAVVMLPRGEDVMFEMALGEETGLDIRPWTPARVGLALK